MIRAGEGNREKMTEEDATLSRRDRQQARSFAVGGHPMSVRQIVLERHTWLSPVCPLSPHRVPGLSHTFPA
jgi:hypothetical protein